MAEPIVIKEDVETVEYVTFPEITYEGESVSILRVVKNIRRNKDTLEVLEVLSLQREFLWGETKAKLIAQADSAIAAKQLEIDKAEAIKAELAKDEIKL